MYLKWTAPGRVPSYQGGDQLAKGGWEYGTAKEGR